MARPTIAQRIRRLLIEGAATTLEMAVTLHETPRRIQANLWCLKHSRHVAPGLRVPVEGIHGGCRLYLITTRGRSFAACKERTDNRRSRKWRERAAEKEKETD